jgi:hypothetical protein
MLSNDASTLSDLATGPDRATTFANQVVSERIGEDANLTARAIGRIAVGVNAPYATDVSVLRQNGAGDYYTVENIDKVLANKFLAKGAGELLGIASGVKLGYDFGTYLEAAYLCRWE